MKRKRRAASPPTLGIFRNSEYQPKTSVKEFRYEITKNMVEPLLLLGAPGHRADQDAIVARRCRLSHLLRLSRRGRSWVLADGQHADLPTITLTNIDR